MHAILHCVVDEALRAADALGDLVADMATGFGSAVPVIGDLDCGAPDGPPDGCQALLPAADR